MKKIILAMTSIFVLIAGLVGCSNENKTTESTPQMSKNVSSPM